MLRYLILTQPAYGNKDAECFMVMHNMNNGKVQDSLLPYVLLWLGMCDTNTMFQKQSDHKQKPNYPTSTYIAQRHLVFHFESPCLNMTISIGPFRNIFMKSNK
jgi:hypothetical protein